MDIITRLRLYFRPSGVVVLVWPAGVGWLVGSWVVSLYLSLLSVSCVVDREGSECGVSECVIQVVCRVTFYHHRLCHPTSDDFTRFFLVVKFSRYSTFRLVV